MMNHEKSWYIVFFKVSISFNFLNLTFSSRLLDRFAARTLNGFNQTIYCFSLQLYKGNCFRIDSQSIIVLFDLSPRSVKIFYIKLIDMNIKIDFVFNGIKLCLFFFKKSVC